MAIAVEEESQFARRRRGKAIIASPWTGRTFKCEDSPGWRSAGARYRWDWAPTRERPPTRRNWNRP